MIEIRAAQSRGRSATSWLDSRHSFSFGEYRDPGRVGWGALRVINEDRLAPGGGFASHPHRDMEILSFIVEGALAHRDSLGNGSRIAAGDVQRMSAGTGVVHSEFNASEDDPVRFLQVWIEPRTSGLSPSYEQRAFPPAGRRGSLQRVASSDARDGSLTVHQDVEVWAGSLRSGDTVEAILAADRRAWLQMVDGAISIGDTQLTAGDGAAISDAARLEIRASQISEFLLFDLA